MTLKDLQPLSKTETIMAERARDEEEAVSAIIERRKYIKQNNEYTSALMREQFRAKYSPRNEKETATMNILYEEDK